MTGQSAGVISLTGLAAGPQQIDVTDETSFMYGNVYRYGNKTELH
jgi:hypothetical protein